MTAEVTMIKRLRIKVKLRPLQKKVTALHLIFAYRATGKVEALYFQSPPRPHPDVVGQSQALFWSGSFWMDELTSLCIRVGGVLLYGWRLDSVGVSLTSEHRGMLLHQKTLI